MDSHLAHAVVDALSTLAVLAAVPEEEVWLQKLRNRER